MACAQFVLMTRKWNMIKWNFNHALQWCHNEHDGVSNHRRLDSLLKRLFSRRSKKTSKLHITSLCEENSPVTVNAEDVPIWWRRHGMKLIWWNGPQDIKATKSEESRPTVTWKGRNESPLIDIRSSSKAFPKSVIDSIDIHNYKMDVYNPVIYIHNSITDIQTCIMEK